MQNIVAHHVRKKRPVPHGNRGRGSWVGCLLCLQGHWRCSSTYLSLCNTAVWGGAEVTRCKNSVKRSRGNHLYRRSTSLGDERKNGAWVRSQSREGMGSRRWFCPGFSKGCPGPAVRPRQCHSSVAAQGQGDLGPCPKSLVLGSPGETDCSSGVSLCLWFSSSPVTKGWGW